MTDEIRQLEEACKQWAETSQENFQKAKRYRQALLDITRNQYGIQAIMEDYPDSESVEYLKAAEEYYRNLVNYYQKLAWEALNAD